MAQVDEPLFSRVRGHAHHCDRTVDVRCRLRVRERRGGSEG